LVLYRVTYAFVGLKTRGGPREIGTAVTKAVVLSFVLVLVFDYYVTRILLFFDLD
jgi:phospholipid/cholesterol/gamma-HCH transport system permease protein